MWAQSESADKASKAWKLFKEIQSRYELGDKSLYPTIETVTLVLSACARAHTSQDNVQISQITSNLHNFVSQNARLYPDGAYFDILIKAYGSCQSREDIITKAFQECCKAGKLNKQILHSLKRFAPNFYAQMPGNDINEKLAIARNNK